MKSNNNQNAKVLQVGKKIIVAAALSTVLFLTACSGDKKEGKVTEFPAVAVEVQEVASGSN